MIISVLLLSFLVATSSVCTTDADCLLLGTCEAGACRCRQGFTGDECGQIDLAPAPVHMGYQNASASTWGGLPVRLNGVWHLYASMMVGGCPLGTFNNNSAVAHFVSTTDSFLGPYMYNDTVVDAFAHNAAPRVLPDGSIGLWFIGYNGHVETLRCPGGVPPPGYVWPDWSGKQIGLARSAPGATGGPWNVSYLFDKPTLPQEWWKWDCASTNPAAVVYEDGQINMMYRGTMCTHCDGCPDKPANATERLGIATAPNPEGPYSRATKWLWLGDGVSVEDPFYWRGANGSHHLIAHSATVCAASQGGNWCGVIASSPDGIRWRLATAPAYGPRVTLQNGTVVELFARQRPQLLFDSGVVGDARSERKLLALANGAMLLEGGSGGLMQRKDSFTLLQPVRQ